MAEQPYPCASQSEPLDTRVRKVLLELLSNFVQPSAWELVEHVEHKIGLKARWEIEPVVKTLASDSKLTHQLRSYLSSLLETSDLSEALEGEQPPRKLVESTVDELLRKGIVYRSSDGVQGDGQLHGSVSRIRLCVPKSRFSWELGKTRMRRTTQPILWGDAEGPTDDLFCISERL